MGIADFIQALPKAELHLHFEGAVPWVMAQAQASESRPDRPDWWADDYVFEDFSHFLEAMRYSFDHVFTNAEGYYKVAQALFEGLVAQNVRYVETSLSPNFILSRGLSIAEVVAAIKQAAPAGLLTSLFFGYNRSRTYSLTDPAVQGLFTTPGIDGIDLHGDERLLGPAPFTELFAQARQSNLAIKAHAGELVGPHSIIEALDHLQVTRIEHGTTAIQDNNLMHRLAAKGITLDLCPTSNLKLGVVANIAGHPIRQFHRRGIPVTVNTDDPGLFGCSLTGELHTLVEKLDFTAPELAQLQVNAFRVARMPPEERDPILAEIDGLGQQLKGSWA